MRAYRAGEATRSWAGWPLRWRAHVVCWAAEHGTKLAGDFVECGVNRGGNARMILEYLGPEFHRPMYLLDTFQGFSESHLSATERARAGQNYAYADCLSDVRETFRAYPFVHVIPGTVPETLSQVPSSQVAFLSIDMNCTAPEIAAAEHFWPRLSPGAIMLLDDYGFSAHIEQKRAFDKFAASKNVPILSLPTGQAVIIKA